ncbi:MAG: membrane protein [Caudoviricetes sp.]|nr:MAG: membrane protein [Caudoviricetes sp.]
MKYLIVVILSLSLASCGIFKKTNKNLDTGKVLVSVKRDSLHTAEIRAENIDKGTIVTETETVTERKREGGKRVVSGKLEQGRNVLLDSVLRELSVTFDSLTRAVSIEVIVPPVDDRTVTKERKTEHKDEKHTEVKKEVAHVRDEELQKVEVKHEVKESKPNYSWIAWVMVVAVGLWLLLRFIKQRHLF